MRTDLFDFDLPVERIALQPARPRDASRLLVVGPGADVGRSVGAQSRGSREPDVLTDPAALTDPGVLTDHHVRDLPGVLRPGDALVLNDTRVIAAELTGHRLRAGSGPGGAAVTFNLHKRLDGSRWLAFARPAKRLQAGDRVLFGAEGRVCMAGELAAVVETKGDEATGTGGEVTLAFSLHGAYLDGAIAEVGRMPLPPYIGLKRPPAPGDAQDYQTIYAARDGAVAAPTAGLHFTPELFAALDARGISRHIVTLHVGAGTFLPVKADDTRDHRMHAEWGEVTPRTAAALNEVRAHGGRIVAVGTTSLRLLESAALADGTLQPFSGDTEIFITPGYRFKAVDLLMTNFHLPRSTLFMLVCAFSGLQTMQNAYAHAIAASYRFYSFGDACLLHPAQNPSGRTA